MYNNLFHIAYLPILQVRTYSYTLVLFSHVRWTVVSLFLPFFAFVCTSALFYKVFYLHSLIHFGVLSSFFYSDLVLP